MDLNRKTRFIAGATRQANSPKAGPASGKCSSTTCAAWSGAFSNSLAARRKQQSSTGAYHYIIFLLRRRACLTLGDGYVVPCTDIPLAEGVVEVPRGNQYSIMNTDDALSATFQCYKARRNARAGPFR